MIILIEAEKAFDKICLHVKNPQQIEYLKGTYNKAIYDRPTANTPNSEMLKDSPVIRNMTRVPNLTTFIQHSNGNPS